MASLAPGIDTTIVADEPVLDDVASAARPLAVGRHIFQLVVTDHAGNRSSADSIAVTVKDRSKPVAQIDFVRPDGTRVYDSSIAVAYGQPFRLTGERSSDANGRVTQWRWTLVSP